MTYKTAYPLHNTPDTIDALMLGADSAVSSCGHYHLSLESDVFAVWMPWHRHHDEALGAFDVELLKAAYADTRWQIIFH